LSNRYILPLQQMTDHDRIRHYWRARGAYWSPQQLQIQLGRGSVFSAVGTLGDADGPLVGLGEILDPSFVDSRAQLSIVTSPDYSRSALPIRFALLFVATFFDRYPIDKLVLEVHADNQNLTPGLHRVLRHEGTFKRHINVGGEFSDVEVFALWRDEVAELAKRFGGPR
jgi:RimJ/RimL family protein N-acetyltransferase